MSEKRQIQSVIEPQSNQQDFVNPNHCTHVTHDFRVTVASVLVVVVRIGEESAEDKGCCGLFLPNVCADCVKRLAGLELAGLVDKVTEKVGRGFARFIAGHDGCECLAIDGGELVVACDCIAPDGTLVRQVERIPATIGAVRDWLGY